MAASSVSVMHTSSCYGSEIDVDVEAPAPVSDYGSEFDASEIDEDLLLASTLDSFTRKASRSVEKISVLPSIEFVQGEAEDADLDDLVTIHKPSLLRVAKRARRSVHDTNTRRETESPPIRETLEIEYDERSRRVWSGMLLLLSWLCFD